MDSELPAVNTAQLETPVFHRDHNEPPSSQQSVTNRCSTSRSFDQNFAQLPSVKVPLRTPIRVGHSPYAEPCTIITDVNHNHHDNTYHTLETPQQVSSRSEGYSNFISPMPVVYPHFDPAFFHRNQIASQPTDHHDDYTANGTELSRFFFSTFRINSFEPAFINFVMGNTSVHAAVGDCHSGWQFKYRASD